MKIKTNELTRAALNWAAARCEGVVWEGPNGELLGTARGMEYFTDWSQGGPIIEREMIAVWFSNGNWNSQMRDTSAKMQGETPLIAAMRCYVASKLGDEVDVPEELA